MIGSKSEHVIRLSRVNISSFVILTIFFYLSAITHLHRSSISGLDGSGDRQGNKLNYIGRSVFFWFV
ncbi:hypothetical protein ZOSMA_181G00460 [Zostera marina]|uniref:Uncharacterized protein n=1 Tax=Zostera marina TaxID=29655 RepID=A0A0K9PT39_ZOSMR|nr:hypothetical protein ZOSMA_181G00460 [Zostera marina]